MHRLFLVAALPCLIGCQGDEATGPMTRAELSGNVAVTPAEARYSLFYDQADHLRDLIAGKRYLQAAELVEKHWPWFEPRLAALGDLLPAAAGHVNAGARPQLDAAAAKLDSAPDFSRPADWPALRRLRGEAMATLAAYDKMALTRRPEFRSDRATALEQAAQRFDAAGRAAAPAAFVDYDHAAEIGFFAAYPIELDRPALLRDRMAALDDRARRLAPDGVLRWRRGLGQDVLDGEQRARVGRWLADAAIRASGARRPGWKEVQAAWRLAAEHGLPASLPERPRMRVVLIGSDLQGGAGGSGVQIAAQGELTPERASLAAAIADPATDLLVLIHPLEQRVDQAVIERSSVASRFLAGEAIVPNPAYDRARLRAIRARDNLALARYRNAASVDEPGTTAEAFAGLANAIGELMAGFRADAAIDDFRKIPPTLRQPVYEDYKYEVATVKANRVAAVAWHVLDRPAAIWRQGQAKVEETRNFRIAYRLHERDVGRERILREHQTEQDLAGWGEAPAVIALDLVLRTAVSGEGAERKLGSFAQVGEELRKGRSAIGSPIRPAPIAGESAAAGDTRMDAVVVIRSPDGSGMAAGFYVTPDTVVTNAHVVEGHRFVDITLRDGRKSFGRVMAVMEYADLAVVRVEARGMPAKLSARAGPEVGSAIEVIGHPKSLEYSLSRGIVSAVRKRRITDTPGAGPITLVQTDAAANPGNSGGPWFQQGEVVAVTSFKLAGGESLNFGIHVSELREFLRKNGIEIP